MLIIIRISHDGIGFLVRTDDGEHSDRFDITQGLRQDCMLSPLLFNLLFAAALHVVLVRFSQDEGSVRHLVQLSGAGVVRTEEQEPLECVRMAAWGMLYADEEGIVSTSAEGLAKMISVNATVFEAAGLTVSETRTQTMLLQTPDQTTLAPPLAIEVAGQR